MAIRSFIEFAQAVRGEIEMPEWQKEIFKRLQSGTPLGDQSYVSMGKTSGKWYFTLRILREMWRQGKSTVMLSANAESVNRPVVIHDDILNNVGSY